MVLFSLFISLKTFIHIRHNTDIFSALTLEVMFNLLIQLTNFDMYIKGPLAR